MRKINETGRSMVEMLGVLAIIGVLSAGGLAGYSKAMFKHKLNSTMDQITMLVTNIRTMYGTQGHYTGLATNVVDLGLVPVVMGSTWSKLTSPFKGKVTIDETETGATNAPASSAFTLKYDSLPREACIALATADFGSGAGSGFIGVDVGAASTAAVGGGSATDHSKKEGASYTVSEATEVCAEGSNTIIWKFY